MMRIKAEISHIRAGRIALSALGGAIMGFGLMEIHSIAQITEGGALGATLILDHFFGISPAISGLIVNVICYLTGWRMFGIPFLVYSLAAAGCFSAAYGICEMFPPLFPEVANMPLLSAFVGAVFVGVGVGLCVRAGGAPTGDDALAMSLSKLFQMKIENTYLISDITVLALSLTYIPLSKIVYSLITVILSGRIIGIVQRTKIPKRRKDTR